MGEPLKPGSGTVAEAAVGAVLGTGNVVAGSGDGGAIPHWSGLLRRTRHRGRPLRTGQSSSPSFITLLCYRATLASTEVLSCSAH
jgi:hypothetical protein